MTKDFTWYWDQLTPGQKANLAEWAGTTYGVLHHVGRGRRRFSPKRALKIVAALKRLGFKGVKKHHMRPDIWDRE